MGNLTDILCALRLVASPLPMQNDTQKYLYLVTGNPILNCLAAVGAAIAKKQPMGVGQPMEASQERGMFVPFPHIIMLVLQWASLNLC